MMRHIVCHFYSHVDGRHKEFKFLCQIKSFISTYPFYGKYHKEGKSKKKWWLEWQQKWFNLTPVIWILLWKETKTLIVLSVCSWGNNNVIKSELVIVLNFEQCYCN